MVMTKVAEFSQLTQAQTPRRMATLSPVGVEYLALAERGPQAGGNWAVIRRAATKVVEDIVT